MTPDWTVIFFIFKLNIKYMVFIEKFKFSKIEIIQMCFFFFFLNWKSNNLFENFDAIFAWNNIFNKSEIFFSEHCEITLESCNIDYHLNFLT